MSKLYSREEAEWARKGTVSDVQSDPEPPVPSLEQPDAGWFHPGPPTPSSEKQ